MIAKAIAYIETVSLSGNARFFKIIEPFRQQQKAGKVVSSSVKYCHLRRLASKSPLLDSTISAQLEKKFIGTVTASLLPIPTN